MHFENVKINVIYKIKLYLIPRGDRMLNKKITELSLSVYKWLNLGANKQKQDKLMLVIIEMWIYDLLTFSIVFIIGLIFGCTVETIIYIIFFSWIRQYSGGFHADTHLKCMSTYFTLYFLFVALLHYSNLSLNLHIAISLLSCAYIIYNAPVQHCNQPLTLVEQKDNRHKAIIIVCVILVMQLLLYVLKSSCLIIFTIILAYSAILMIIQKKSKNFRGNDL